jgi:hypothetical protein
VRDALQEDTALSVVSNPGFPPNDPATADEAGSPATGARSTGDDGEL